MKKKIYMVQANSALSGALFLPYSVGTLVAYAFLSETVKKEYEFCEFIYKKEPADIVLQRMEEPFFIGFSSYCWNVEYNLSLACAVKEKWPKCKVVFGGHQIPEDGEYLEKYGFIDILMHGEGEYSFRTLLEALASGDELSETPNISFRDKYGVIYTTRQEKNKCLEELPSPYTSGLFDSIINDPENEGIQFDAVVETNRGCPYGCVYCSWSCSSMRRFSLERVKGDLKWISDNKIAYVFCSDANFGFYDRDEEIADYVIELKNKTGYPQRFENTSDKNKADRVFRINKKLTSSGLNRGVSVAVQSMSEDVLKKIKRKNAGFGVLSDTLREYRENGICTYTDVILGLPGETFDSFCRGLLEVVEAGQHNSIYFFRCEMLPNTELASQQYREKYGIKTVNTLANQRHSPKTDDDNFCSRVEFIVQTNTLTCDEWCRATVIATMVQSFHCMGLLRYIAIYLRKSHGISYYGFYMGLYRYIYAENGFLKENFDKISEKLKFLIDEKRDVLFYDESLSDVGWAYDEWLFIVCARESERFYEQVREYIMPLFGDDERAEDLMKYQQDCLNLPGKSEMICIYRYDWKQYFDSLFDGEITVPQKEKTVLRFADEKINSWKDYAREIVWYGRRDDRMLKKGESLSIEYYENT